MKKNKDINLETLDKLSQMQKNILQSVYRDFFTEEGLSSTPPSFGEMMTPGNTGTSEAAGTPGAAEMPGNTGAPGAAKSSGTTGIPDSYGSLDPGSLDPTDVPVTEDTLAKVNAELKEILGAGAGLFGDITSEAPQPAASSTSGEKTAEVQAAEAAEAKEEPETDPMEELNELVGLDKIKHDVRELTDFVKMQKMREKEGLKSVPTSLHLVFTGNPGTGKTTVARILSRIYKQIGALSKGQLVEVDRSGLVAGYVGQTALKTQEKIQEAMGGVLFIDEAYSLSKKDDTFGEEAIDTILKAMEDNRKDLVVIVAGYTEPMKKFIESNPGLKSRFNKYIEFPDYTVEELEKIFYMNCKKYDYKVAEDAKDRIRTMILSRKVTKLENFANAREVRNMFEEIITNQARRVVCLESPTQEDLMTITCEDLEDSVAGAGIVAPEAAAETETGPETSIDESASAGESVDIVNDAPGAADESGAEEE